MQEIYTSDFPRMKHGENITTGYIMASAAAGSDNQLRGKCNLLQVCASLVCSFVFQVEGWIIINSEAKSSTQPVRAA